MSTYSNNRKRRRKQERRVEKVTRMAANRLPELRRRHAELTADPELMADPFVRQMLDKTASKLNRIAREIGQ